MTDTVLQADSGRLHGGCQCQDAVTAPGRPGFRAGAGRHRPRAGGTGSGPRQRTVPFRAAWQPHGESHGHDYPVNRSESLKGLQPARGSGLSDSNAAPGPQAEAGPGPRPDGAGAAASVRLAVSQ